MGTKGKDRTWSGRGFGGGRQLYTRSPEIAQPSVIGATCEFQGNTASPADRARIGEDVLATLGMGCKGKEGYGWCDCVGSRRRRLVVG